MITLLKNIFIKFCGNCGIATWVDGGYIMGSAEVVFTSGVVWCQAPFGYAVALFLGNYQYIRSSFQKVNIIFQLMTCCKS